MKQTEDRKKYMREYRKRNREKLNAYRRKWMQDHPGKEREYKTRFYLKTAEVENNTNGL